MKQAEMAKWLKVLTLFTGAVGLVFTAFIAPELVGAIAESNPAFRYLVWPGIIFIWLTAIPVYLCLYKVWLICAEINRNNSFSKQSAALLRDISHLALIDSALYLLIILLMVVTRHFDILVLVLLFGAIIFGVFVAVVTAALSHLTVKASDLKQENDLTI